LKHKNTQEKYFREEKMKTLCRFNRHDSDFDIVGAIYIYSKLHNKMLSKSRLKQIRNEDELHHMIYSQAFLAMN